MSVYTGDRGDLRVAAVNLQHGGFDADGSAGRLGKTVAALDQLRPHVVLLQELAGLPPGPLEALSWDMPLADREKLAADAAARAHDAARRHLWHLAARLGMTPVLGPPVPGRCWRMHTAVLVREEDGIEVTGTGPPPVAVPGDENPAWCEAILAVSGIPHLLSFYAVQLPARTAAGQLMQAQRLANVIARQSCHAHAAGDWNSIPRTEQPSEDELAAMRPHLRTVHMVLDDGPLRPDYAVDDVMTGTGLTDVAVSLPPGRRVPSNLLPTGPAGSRTDRHYATAELADAAIGYRQAVTGGSGHHMTMVSYDPAVLALAEPPGQGTEPPRSWKGSSDVS